MTDRERYESALRKMQSGVAFDMAHDGQESAKHLRTGINNALVLNGALSRLLVAKGIISEAEYWAAMAEGMEEEVARYKRLLEKKTGTAISLGEAGGW